MRLVLNNKKKFDTFLPTEWQTKISSMEIFNKHILGSICILLIYSFKESSEFIKTQKIHKSIFKIHLSKHREIYQMQVQSYKQLPISQVESLNFDSTQRSLTNQNLNNQPLKQLINSTIDSINQSINEVINGKNNQNNVGQSDSNHSFQDDWNILYFIRLLFYLVVILKVIELVFNKYRKMNVKERVYRKYVISHSEIIRQFNDEDRNTMETTLNNTIKNAYIDRTYPKMAKKPSIKRVIFHEGKNQYFQASKNQQNNNEQAAESALQAFLSQNKTSPFVRTQQMRRQVSEDQPQEIQFQITETITQSTQVTQRKLVFGDEQKTQKNIESVITQGTQSSDNCSTLSSELNINSVIKENKQKDL